jgi:lipoic acid synthetase
VAQVTLPAGEGYRSVKDIVSINGLHTVCQEAMCPNIAECWSAGTATLMLLGSTCTRACRFCAVDTGTPGAAPTPPNPSTSRRPSRRWA